MNPALLLRWSLREFRHGEWRVLLVALSIAVAAMASVGFFQQRVNSALNQEAHALLAADSVVSSDHPIGPPLYALARSQHLATAETVSFPTMALTASGAQLVSLKAVSQSYPLRGTMQLTGRNGLLLNTGGAPARGSVWLEPRLLNTLGLHLGDSLQLGSSHFAITRQIVREPDNAMSLFNIAPRAMINADDLPATGLVVEGSRVRYRLLLSGEKENVDRFTNLVGTQLERGQHLESLDNARPELKAALDRARQFLALAALASVALAAAAIALAARRYLLRHMDSAALLVCLGAPHRWVRRLFAVQALIAASIGSGSGLLLGLWVQGPLTRALAPDFAADLPPPSAAPGLIAMACGVVLLLGCMWPALLMLQRTPALRVLRHDLQAPPVAAWLAIGSLLAILTLLAWWQTGAPGLAVTAIAGFCTLLTAAAGSAALLLWLLRRASQSGHALGLAGLRRHPWLVLAQIAALSLGVMALLALTVVKTQLLSNWQQSLPADAPNQFLINIQPDQRAGLAAQLRGASITGNAIVPMVRGRLLRINQRRLNPNAYADEQTRMLAEREFNLSSATSLAEDNHLVAGRWWGTSSHAAEFSVEQGIAQRLGIKLGDTLVYDIAGSEVSARVSSIRAVRWDSFRTNFYVLASPGVLDSQPTSYITALYVPPAQTNLIVTLVRSYPNLTVIDVTPVMAQVHQLIDRVSRAVQYLFLFCVAAGITVLYAALAASSDERAAEIALLRTLGASRRQVRSGLLLELATIGALAGALAALGAELLAWAVSRYLLELPWNWSLTPLAIGSLGCAALCVVGTLPWMRRILATPPAQVLRNAS